MYKVMIVDDEELAIRSLRATVDWKHYGFQIIDTANDGIEALDKIIKNKPDLVFTDIRMPGFTGLELIQHVNKHQSGLLFVLISGYAEFKYAQKAMKMGVAEYCVKPFDEDEIEAVLVRMKKILDANNRSITDVIDMWSDVSTDSIARIGQLFKKHGLHAADGIVPVVVRGNRLPTLSSEFRTFAIPLGLGKHAVFIQNTLFALNRAAILDELLEQSDSVGYADPVFAYSDVRMGLEQANMAVYQCFLHGKRGAYAYKTMDSILFSECQRNLHKSILLKDVQGAELNLAEIIRLIAREGNIKHAYRLYSSVMESLMQVDEEELFDDYLIGFDDLILHYGDLESMAKNLKDQFAGLSIVSHSPDVHSPNKLMQEIAQYIYQNFMLPELSLDFLAKRYFVNPSYLSQMFRRDLGTKFTDFITGLRMDYAIHLLKTTELSIQEISTRSGYTDYYYFTKLFKKKFQQRPSEVRS